MNYPPKSLVISIANLVCLHLLQTATPDRKATYTKQRSNILNYLGFEKFDIDAQKALESWVGGQSRQGMLPDELLKRAETFLLSKRIVLPGASILKRLVISVCSEVHEKIFKSLYLKIPSNVKRSIDQMLTVPEGERTSYFYKLKEYPPSAKISSLQSYLERYQSLEDVEIDEFQKKLNRSVIFELPL